LAKASPKIDRLVEYNRHTHRIIYESSFIGVLSSEHRGASGQRVKMAFVDELHEHPKPDLLYRIQKGTKSVKDPLIFIATNSGVDRHSICFHYHDWSERVLRASVPGGDAAFADDQLFA
jgi:phage terminase large subunit-like protein